eukprot:2868214-Alexandrium_andersonii.AAC.1
MSLLTAAPTSATSPPAIGSSLDDTPEERALSCSQCARASQGFAYLLPAPEPPAVAAQLFLLN